MFVKQVLFITKTTEMVVFCSNHDPKIEVKDLNCRGVNQNGNSGYDLYPQLSSKTSARGQGQRADRMQPTSKVKVEKLVESFLFSYAGLECIHRSYYSGIIPDDRSTYGCMSVLVDLRLYVL
jgi:hypothetical protein